MLPRILSGRERKRERERERGKTGYFMLMVVPPLDPHKKMNFFIVLEYFSKQGKIYSHEHTFAEVE